MKSSKKRADLPCWIASRKGPRGGAWWRWRRAGAGAAPGPSYSASHTTPAVRSWRGGTRDARARSKRNPQVMVWSSSNDPDPASASNWLDPGMREEMPDSLCYSRWRPWLPACQCRTRGGATTATRELQREALWWRGSACLARSRQRRPSAQLRASRCRRCPLVRSPLSAVRREKDGGRTENGARVWG
jgi:hypothetical protein